MVLSKVAVHSVGGDFVSFFLLYFTPYLCVALLFDNHQLHTYLLELELLESRMAEIDRERCYIYQHHLTSVCDALCKQQPYNNSNSNHTTAV